MSGKEKVKEIKREELFKLLINKMKVVECDIIIKNSCVVNREFFYTSIPNGEIRDNMSFKIVDLYHEFASEIYDYCKSNNIQIKSNNVSKIVYFIKKQ